MSLSPFAFLAAALAALLGVVAVWSGSVPAALLWRTIVAVVVVGIAYELFITRRLDVRARWLRKGRLYLGAHAELDLEIENRTARDLALEVLPLLPPALAAPREPRTVQVRGRATARAAVSLRPLELGEHSLPRVPVRFRGPLGLAWWSRALPVADRMRVLPDTLGPRALVRPGSSDRGSTPRAVLGGGRELHHLRPYQAGDPRHTIDWKATARASHLVTRVFSEDQHLEVMVLIDVGRTARTEIDGLQQVGHYANLAARLAEYCVAGDDRVGLMAFADRPLVTLSPGRGNAAVTRIRAALAGLAPHAVESDVLSAALHMRKLVRHRCLVVILTDLYERSASSQLAQSARLLVPRHLPLIVGLLGDDVVGLAERRATEWLDPYLSLAAREYERQVAANVARLAQLGAHALIARPTELDRKVLDRYRLLRAQRRI